MEFEQGQTYTLKHDSGKNVKATITAVKKIGRGATVSFRFKQGGRIENDHLSSVAFRKAIVQ